MEEAKSPKAQFKQIKTNVKMELYKKIQERVQEIDSNTSAYIQTLIKADLENNLINQAPPPKEKKKRRAKMILFLILQTVVFSIGLYGTYLLKEHPSLLIPTLMATLAVMISIFIAYPLNGMSSKTPSS
jgi:uncharacterized membrane protein YgaE (UPF0421/DUF939 family)